MLVAGLVVLLGLGVVGFTHLDILRKNKQLANENEQLKKEVNLLSDTVVKENP
jgi:cell division protein FtsB